VRGRKGGFCSLKEWKRVIDGVGGGGGAGGGGGGGGARQLSLERCSVISDGSTWRESIAAQALTLLPKSIADESIAHFEAGTCKKRSAYAPHSPEAYAANEAYMRDVGLTPEHMHECRVDKSIMNDWQQTQQTPQTSPVNGLLGFIQSLVPLPAHKRAYTACAKKYADVNALFGRCNPVEMTVLESAERDWIAMEASPRLPPLYDKLPWQIKEEMTIVSPAQNFAVVFPRVKDSKQLWIKGTQYSISALLGGHQALLDSTSNVLATYVFRLTPRHYHRFHMPVTGDIVGMVFLGKRHLSVQPVLLQDERTNVFTENVRVVLFVRTAYFGTVAIVIVGAPCVFSIVLSHPDHAEQIRFRQALDTARLSPGMFVKMKQPIFLRKRQPLGLFRYGSTILLLLSLTSTIVLSSHLVIASANQIETEIRVGQPIVFSTIPLQKTSAAAVAVADADVDAGALASLRLPTNAKPLSVVDFSLC
jgi:phosphatidylserine decarboxylase precursor